MITDYLDHNDDDHHHHHIHHQQHQPGLPRQARSREPGRSHQEDEAGSVQVAADYNEDDEDVNEGDKGGEVSRIT